jgi:hypothetical protein
VEAGLAARQDDPVQVAAEIVAAMEADAAGGDWDSVGRLAVRLQAAILHVPERERRRLLLAARQSVQKVQQRAREARDDLAGKLTALRRGRDMTAAYTAKDRGPVR